MRKDSKTDMTTQEERISRPEQGFANEQEWRRDIVNEMRAGFERLDAKIDRLDTKFNWTIGLLIGMLLAIITGFLGIIAAIIDIRMKHPSRQIPAITRGVFA